MWSRATSIRCLIVFAVVGGCADPLTPIGPGHEFVPEKDEMRLWETTRRMTAELSARGSLYEDEELRSYMQSVLLRLIDGDKSAYAPLDIRVKILASESVNAFAFADGSIFVHTGILGRIRNEAQLAMLLGHEMAHNTHRHLFQRHEDYYTRTGAFAYVSVVSVLGGQNMHDLVSELGKLITIAAVSGYGKSQESESDRVGLLMMARAGYDPREGAQMFHRMLAATESKNRGPGLFYATHPHMKERGRSCDELISQLPQEYLQQDETGADRYVEHASALIYQEARRHITQGQFDMALDTLSFMRKSRPTDGIAQGLTGDLYSARREAGDELLARESYQAALGLDPGAAGALRGLGLLLAKAGETDSAIEHLERYLTASPDASDVAYIRSYIEQLRGEK